MKKAKKILVMVAALALTAAIAVGGTLAYLTSQTEVVKNTFTVGKVAITLDETNVDNDEYENEAGEKEVPTRDQANDYKLMPGSSYIKDPIIHVSADSEASWLFVKLENGLKDIIADTTIEKQMIDNGWGLLDGSTDTYKYHLPVTGGSDIHTFDNFTIISTIENDALAKYVSVDADGNETSAKIEITAYAIQAEGFDTAAEAWAAAPASWT